MAVSNLFEGTIEFRLVDSDSIVLSGPNYIVIEDPDKFDEAIIRLDRKEEDRGGVNFEYGDEETLLGFYGREVGGSTDVKDTIESILASEGSDFNIVLELYHDSELLYNGNLIGSSYDRQDDAIYFRVKRFDAGNKIKTRWKTPVNVESTEDLDGNAISALTMRNMPLHSGVKKDVEDRSNDTTLDVGLTDIEWQATTPTAAVGYWVPGAPVQNEGSIKEYIDYGNVTFASDSDQVLRTNEGFSHFDEGTTPELSRVYNFKYRNRKGEVSVRIDADLDFYATELTSPGASSMNYTIDVRGVHKSAAGDVISDQSFGSATGAIEKDPVSTAGADIDLIFDVTRNYTMSRGDELYLYVRFRITSGSIGSFPVFMGIPANTSPTNDEGVVQWDVTITDLNEENPSLCEGAYFNEMFDRVLEGVSGDSGMFESTLFTNRPVDSAANACGGLNFIPTGTKIRQRNDDLITSIEDLWSLAKSRYGCGHALYYDSGTLKFLVEKQSHFFQDKKIITLSNVANPVIKRINRNIIFNQLEVGFEKFARSNEAGTSEGFSTRTDYLTAIQKDEKKLSILSKLIGDSTEIERVRRNGLENASDQSDEKDDDGFVIKIHEFGGTEYYSPSDYGSGTRLNIQRDADNDRIIINGLIINGLSTNDYINIVGETNRQISGAPIFDYENNRTILPCTTETQNDTIYADFNFRQSDDSTIRYTYNPERIEGFSAISGLVDEFSVYNLDHANTQFLFHNFSWFGGSMEQKDGLSEKVRFLTKKAITTLSKNYVSATCGLNTSAINERNDFLLSSLRSWNPAIFSPFVYEIEVRIPFSDLKTIKEALRNESASDINYGYIEFPDNDGTLKKGYPFLIEYNPLEESVSMVLWEKKA